MQRGLFTCTLATALSAALVFTPGVTGALQFPIEIGSAKTVVSASLFNNQAISQPSTFDRFQPPVDPHTVYETLSATGQVLHPAIATGPAEPISGGSGLTMKTIMTQASSKRLKRLMQLVSDDDHGPMVAIDHTDADRHFGDKSLNVAAAQTSVIEHMDYVHGFLINPRSLASHGELSEDVPIKPVIIARWDGDETNRSGKAGGRITTQEDEDSAITLDRISTYAAAIRFCVFVDSRHPEAMAAMVSKIEKVVRDAHAHELPVIIEVLPARAPDMQAIQITNPTAYARWVTAGTLELVEAIAHIPYEGIKYPFPGTLATQAGRRAMSNVEITNNFSRLKRAVGGRLGFMLSGGVEQDLPQQMNMAAQHNLLSGFLYGRGLWQAAFMLPSGSPSDHGTREWDLEQGDSRERYLRARAILLDSPSWYVQAGYTETEWTHFLHEKGLFPQVRMNQITVQPAADLAKHFSKVGYEIPGEGGVDIYKIYSEMEDLKRELPAHIALFFNGVSSIKLNDLRQRLGLRNTLGPCQIQSIAISLLDASLVYRMIYRLDFTITVPDKAFHQRLAQLRTLLSQPSHQMTIEALDEKGISYNRDTGTFTLLYNGITIDAENRIQFPAIVKISADKAMQENDNRQLELYQHSEDRVVHTGGLFMVPPNKNIPLRYAIVQTYVDGVVVTDTQNTDVRHHLSLMMQAIFETFIYFRSRSQGTLRRLPPWKILTWYDYSLRHWRATLIDLKEFIPTDPGRVLNLVAVIEDLFHEEIPLGLPAIGIESMLASIQFLFSAESRQIVSEAYTQLQPYAIRNAIYPEDVKSSILRGLHQLLRRRFSPAIPVNPISSGQPDIMDPAYAQSVIEDHRRMGAVREIPLESDDETSISQSLFTYWKNTYWPKNEYPLPPDILEKINSARFFLVDNLGSHNLFMRLSRGDAQHPHFLGWYYDADHNDYYFSTALLEKYFMKPDFEWFLGRICELDQSYRALEKVVRSQSITADHAHELYITRHQELFETDAIYHEIVKVAQASAHFEKIPWRSPDQGIHLINSFIESNIEGIMESTGGALLVFIDGVRKVGKTFIIDHLKKHGVANILPGLAQILVYHYDSYIEKHAQLAELIQKSRSQYKIIIVEGVGSMDALSPLGIVPDLLVMMTAGLLTRQANIRPFQHQILYPITHEEHLDGIVEFANTYVTRQSLNTLYIDNSIASTNGRRLSTDELKFFFNSGGLNPDVYHMAIHHPIPRHPTLAAA